MHFDLIHSIHDSDHLYFFHQRKLKLRLFRLHMDRAWGPKWVLLDFLLYIWFLRPDSAGADPLPDGKRDFLSWYGMQQVVSMRKPCPVQSRNAM